MVYDSPRQFSLHSKHFSANSWCFQSHWGRKLNLSQILTFCLLPSVLVKLPVIVLRGECEDCFVYLPQLVGAPNFKQPALLHTRDSTGFVPSLTCHPPCQLTADSRVFKVCRTATNEPNWVPEQKRNSWLPSTFHHHFLLYSLLCGLNETFLNLVYLLDHWQAIQFSVSECHPCACTWGFWWVSTVAVWPCQRQRHFMIQVLWMSCHGWKG